MNERLFARLHTLLSAEPVVLASVIDTRGATPRKGGSRMLIAQSQCHGSVGGGLAEARVIEAGRQLLQRGDRSAAIEIDLSGQQGASGVCGGRMRIGLRRWAGDADHRRVGMIAQLLASGHGVTLTEADLGGGKAQEIEADIRLLIIGGGHCGLALHDLARHLDFDLWIYDERAAAVAAFTDAAQLTGPVAQLQQALDTPREVFAVCLNRDFHTDIAALRVLAQQPPRFIGMMGSARRIAEVRAALPQQADALAELRAPVGIDIGAQTPHEIAVSILAELIAARRRLDR